jgi:DNA-directed RNA polymerase I subunit RPA43
MSIEIDNDPQTSVASPKKHKDRSEKKHKSDGEKKRKRDREEDVTSKKSKKHRSEGAAEKSSQIVTEESQDVISSRNDSPFHLQTSSLYLALAPISQRYPLEGICAEHISPLILTYYPPFRGVVLSYSNPRLSQKSFHNDGEEILMKSIDEYGASWSWLTAEFLIFKPQRGGELEGYINLQNEGHLGLVCWNLFNASIERKRLPKEWKWIGVEGEEKSGEGYDYAEDGIGYYVDGEGKRIEGTIKFRVKDTESSHDRERGFFSIEGTMLDEKDEKELLDSEKASWKATKVGAGRRLGGARALGATSLGVPVEIVEG